jgi:hypothetical protein
MQGDRRWGVIGVVVAIVGIIATAIGIIVAHQDAVDGRAQAGGTPSSSASTAVPSSPRSGNGSLSADTPSAPSATTVKSAPRTYQAMAGDFLTTT